MTVTALPKAEICVVCSSVVGIPICTGSISCFHTDLIDQGQLAIVQRSLLHLSFDHGLSRVKMSNLEERETIESGGCFARSCQD
jgi:hypothetical protein